MNWRDDVSHMTCKHLGVQLDELEEVTLAKEVWSSLLRLLPPQPDSGQSGRVVEDGSTDGGMDEYNIYKCRFYSHIVLLFAGFSNV